MTGLCKTPVLKVAISVPLSRVFDYLPPADGPVPAIGARVQVQFGPRRQVGLVIGHAESSELPAERIRRCAAVLDDKALLGEAELRLVRFTSDYYHHPIGEVVAAALPALLRHGKALHPLAEMIAATELSDGTTSSRSPARHRGSLNFSKRFATREAAASRLIT